MKNPHESYYAAVVECQLRPDYRKLWMRILKVSCLFSCLLCVQNYLFARTSPYFYTLSSKQSLPYVLGKLEDRYGIEFAYSYTDFSEIEVEKGFWSGESLEGFLFKILEPHQIIFK